MHGSIRLEGGWCRHPSELTYITSPSPEGSSVSSLRLAYQITPKENDAVKANEEKEKREG